MRGESMQQLYYKELKDDPIYDKVMGEVLKVKGTCFKMILPIPLEDLSFTIDLLACDDVADYPNTVINFPLDSSANVNYFKQLLMTFLKENCIHTGSRAVKINTNMSYRKPEIIRVAGKYIDEMPVLEIADFFPDDKSYLKDHKKSLNLFKLGMITTLDGGEYFDAIYLGKSYTIKYLEGTHSRMRFIDKNYELVPTSFDFKIAFPDCSNMKVRINNNAIYFNNLIFNMCMNNRSYTLSGAVKSFNSKFTHRLVFTSEEIFDLNKEDLAECVLRKVSPIRNHIKNKYISYESEFDNSQIYTMHDLEGYLNNGCSTRSTELIELFKDFKSKKEEDFIGNPANLKRIYKTPFNARTMYN